MSRARPCVLSLAPRWARRLSYAILLVTAIELALFIAALVWALGRIWLATPEVPSGASMVV